MNQMVVFIAVILISIFILWWFFGKHEASEATAIIEGNMQTATITVNGGYTPSVLVLKKGVPASLQFNRKDVSTCLEEVMFPDFGIRTKLPYNENFVIPFDTSKAGEFEYACGMNMFHGKIIIK